MEKAKQKFFSAILYTLSLVALFAEPLSAQRPTHIPKETPPVSFFESPSNIIFYIVIPLIIVIVYFLWRRNTKREKKKKEERLK